MPRRVLPKQASFVRQVSNPGDLGEALRAERIRRGLSQEVLGTLLGETRHKIQQMEAGAEGVAVGSVLRALRDLGVALVTIPPRADPPGDPASAQAFDCAEELLSQLRAHHSSPAPRTGRTGR